MGENGIEKRYSRSSLLQCWSSQLINHTIHSEANNQSCLLLLFSFISCYEMNEVSSELLIIYCLDELQALNCQINTFLSKRISRNWKISAEKKQIPRCSSFSRQINTFRCSAHNSAGPRKTAVHTQNGVDSTVFVVVLAVVH